MNNKITYEGSICCVTLEDGTKLYGPQTLPDKIYTRKYDQIVICGANERSSDEIISFEHLQGILETNDTFRAPSMRRWHLVDLLGYDILE